MAQVTFQQRSQLRRARQILRDAGILRTPDQTLRAAEHARNVARWVKQEEDARAVRREQYREGKEFAEQLQNQALSSVASPIKTGRKTLESLTPGIAEKMAVMYAKGVSAEAVGRRFHCSNVTVLRLLRKVGVEIRIGSRTPLLPKTVVAANLQPANAPPPAPRVEPVREPESIIRPLTPAQLMAGRAIPFRRHSQEVRQ